MMLMSDVTITVREHRTRRTQIAAWMHWLFHGPTAVRAADFEPYLEAVEDTGKSEWPAAWAKLEKGLNLVLNA